MDKDTLADLERQREHNERMRKAGEEVAAMMDQGAEEQRASVTEAIFSALRQRHGLSEEDRPDDAA